MRWTLFRSEIAAFPLGQAERNRYDGMATLYNYETNYYLDLYNPQTKRVENTMWHFCNNHDQWRMAAMDDANGLAKFQSCLGWLTFWPGVPLHYAGDEQAFKTYGTALDGWAREELTVQLAWRTLDTLPLRDNFDMAHPMYVWIQQLNRLRQAYLVPVIECDEPLHTQSPASSRIFAWERGCKSSVESRLLIALNLDEMGSTQNTTIHTSWAANTTVVELLTGTRLMVRTGGQLAVSLPPHAVMALVPESQLVTPPPVVRAVVPAHDELVSPTVFTSGLEIRLTFDGAVAPAAVADVLLDGAPVLPSSWCLAATCTELQIRLPAGDQLAAGVHELTLHFADKGAERIGGTFKSRFRVANAAAAHDVISDPTQYYNPLLISADFTTITHAAAGATHWRARTADQPIWQTSAWMPLTDSAFKSSPGVPTIVTYYAAGSSSYVIAGCREVDSSPCPASFHAQMALRAGLWGAPQSMSLVDHYTWQAELQVGTEPTRFWLDPLEAADGTGKKFGIVMDVGVQRALEASGKFGTTGGHTTMASGAEHAQQIVVDACCSVYAQEQAPGQPGVWQPLQPCELSQGLCSVTFNDLTFALTSHSYPTPPSPPADPPAPPAPPSPPHPPAAPSPPAPSPPCETDYIAPAEAVGITSCALPGAHSSTTAAVVTPGACRTDLCELSIRLHLGVLSGGQPVRHLGIAGKSEGDFEIFTTPSALDANGTYEARFYARNHARFLYTLVIDDDNNVHDPCAALDSDLGMSYVDVACDMSRCKPSSCSMDGFGSSDFHDRGAQCKQPTTTDPDNAATLNGGTTIVQLFEWPYADVGAECSRLGAQGWTAVEIVPPASHHVPEGEARDVPEHSWLERRLPVDLANLTSRSGTGWQLQEMIRECAEAGVQVYAQVELNQAASSAKLDQFFRTDAAAEHHTACEISELTSAFNVQQCRLDGPDRNTALFRVRRQLASHLNLLLSLGIAGFRILDSNLISHSDLGEIFDEMNGLRHDIQRLANISQPVLIFEPWTYQQMRDPEGQQPEKAEDVTHLLTPAPYLQLSDVAYTTDHAWTLRAAEAWLCDLPGQPRCNETSSLEQITEWSSDYYSPGVRSPLWRFNRGTTMTRVVRSLNNAFLNVFAVRPCSEGVCPKAMLSSFHAPLSALSNVWMLGLPGGSASVFSSYDWRREYDTYTAADANWQTGPPRTAAGMTAPVSCGAEDVTPDIFDDGLSWGCEHRQALISAMPKWRREVEGSWSIMHLVQVDTPEGATVIAFGRSVETGGNKRRHGWIAVNRGNTSLEAHRFDTGLPAGKYADLGGEHHATGFCAAADKAVAVEVDPNGRATVTVPAMGAVILHTGEASLDDAEFNLTSLIIILAVVLLPLPLALVAFSCMWQRSQIEVRTNTSVCQLENNQPGCVDDVPGAGVLMACLEHVIPELGIKVVAGGLGNVAKHYIEHMPIHGKFVFAMVGGEDYSRFKRADFTVILEDTRCKVFTYSSARYPNVQFVGLKHPWFLARTKKSIYPDGRKPHEFLQFMSLWNRAVAYLLTHYRNAGEINLFHAVDYHAGLAPIYLEAQGEKPIPVAVTLHNALYQGSMLETLGPLEWRKIEALLRLPAARFYCDIEGDFNMLHAICDYVRHHQNGRGITGVSHRYAEQLGIEIPLLKGLEVLGHPNPMLETSRPKLPEGVTLMQHKAACKAKVQEQLGFTVNPHAVLISFIGRWSYEKGVDLIADIVPWLLDRFPEVQMYLCGPVGDEAGKYAATKLVSLAQIPALKRRLFVKDEFYLVTPEMRFAADYTICPSRTEPFGYVDIEFGWHGCPTIGYLVGGLGKVPGVYFRTLDPNDRLHTIAQLKKACLHALRLDLDTYRKAATAAFRTFFSLEEWVHALKKQYVLALQYEGQMTKRTLPLAYRLTASHAPAGTGAGGLAASEPSLLVVASTRLSNRSRALSRDESSARKDEIDFELSTTRSRAFAAAQSHLDPEPPSVRQSRLPPAVGAAAGAVAPPYDDNKPRGIKLVGGSGLAGAGGAPVRMRAAGPALPTIQSVTSLASMVDTSSETPVESSSSSSDDGGGGGGCAPVAETASMPAVAISSGRDGAEHAAVAESASMPAPVVGEPVTTAAAAPHHLNVPSSRPRLSVQFSEPMADSVSLRIQRSLSTNSRTSPAHPRASPSPSHRRTYQETSARIMRGLASPQAPASRDPNAEASAQPAGGGGRLPRELQGPGSRVQGSLPRELVPQSTRESSFGEWSIRQREAEVSEFEAKMNADDLDKIVGDSTVQELFLGDGGIKRDRVMSSIIQEAYAQSLLGTSDSAITAFLCRTFLGVRLQNLLLSAMCACVPLGSLAVVAVPLYANPNAWSHWEIGSLFAAHSMTIGVGAHIWYRLTMYFHIPTLLFLGTLPQLALVPILYAGCDGDLKWLLYVLAVVNGLGTSAVEALFIAFNYIDEWACDAQIATLRIALVEPARFLTTFIFLGLLTRLSPSTAVGYTYDVGAWASSAATHSPTPPLALVYLFGALSLAVVAMGVLCLWMPIDASLRMPRVRLNVSLFRSYMHLSAAEAFSRLGGFLDVVFVSWMLIAGWGRAEIASFFYAVGGAGFVVASLACLLCMHTRGATRVLLLGPGLLLFPPTTLGLIGLYSAPEIGSASVAFFLGAGLVLTLLKRMASSLLTFFSLPSRWKYLTFQAHATVLHHALSAASPFVLLALSEWWDLPYRTSGDFARSDVFARSSLILSLPFAMCYFLVHLVSLKPLFKEGVLPWFVKSALPPELEVYVEV